MLHHEHKVFIKKIMCEPQNVTQNDFAELDRLQPEERAHVSLIVMETKRRVELIYLTKIMSQFVNL